MAETDSPIQIALSALAPVEWFTKPNESSVWLRIYTCLFIPHDDFAKALTSMFGVPREGSIAVRLGGRLIYAFGRANDIIVPQSTFDITSADSGQLQIAVKIDSKELPDTPSVFLATPYRTDGNPGDEASARSCLDEVAALICIHAGQNLMRQVVFEGEVEATGGQLNVSGEPMKMPQPAEGPFLGAQNGDDIYEIAGALRALTDENKRRRLLLALQLIDRAMRGDFGFLEYWTALEVVCDGGANRIKTTLSKVYRIRSHNKAAEVTRLAVIAQWRHDYVHKGVKPTMNADVERYLQLLFLDTLRFELGLPSRGHLSAIQKSANFDLSQLGIASPMM
jgi:hypothetical protein